MEKLNEMNFEELSKNSLLNIQGGMSTGLVGVLLGKLNKNKSKNKITIWGGIVA